MAKMVARNLHKMKNYLIKKIKKPSLEYLKSFKNVDLHFCLQILFSDEHEHSHLKAPKPKKKKKRK